MKKQEKKKRKEDKEEKRKDEKRRKNIPLRSNAFSNLDRLCFMCLSMYVVFT